MVGRKRKMVIGDRSEFIRWRIARGERIAAESEQRQQRIAAARSAAAAMGADVFRAFIRGVNDGD